MMKRLIDLIRPRPKSLPPEPVSHPVPETALFDEKTVVVAGGAGCIGNAIALEMLSQGAKVIALDRDTGGLDALAKQADNARLETMTLDFTDAAAVSVLNIPACDILIFAAGIQHEADSLADTEEQWSHSLEANIAGPARLVRRMVPLLEKSAGNIVLITSIHAQLPSRWASYSAAKAAQTAMMREWAVDLAPRGVRVNAIAPGWVSAEAQSSKLALLHNRTIPPEYIARAATVLASEHHSRFTTGSVVTVDAGASLFSGRVPFDLPSGNGP